MKILCWSTLGAALLGALAAAAPQIPAPPAGEYACNMTSLAMINGMLPQVSFSVLHSVVLDSKGGYVLQNKNGGPGQYSYDPDREAFSFKSGKMAVFGVRYEYADDGFKKRFFRLQLIDKKTGKDSSTFCTLSAKTTGKPLTNIKATSRVPSGGTARNTVVQPSAGNPNPGLSGTLVFYEANNVGAIQSLELASGKKQTRLSGTDPFVAKNGELIYVNKQSEIGIADKTYRSKLTLNRGDESGDVSQPVLSPDGQQVAYVLDAYPSWRGVVVRSRGGQVLAKFEWKLSPSWTPDGRLVLAEDAGFEGHKPALYLSSSDLKAISVILVKIDDIKQPAVSPDGNRVAFVSNGDIWTANLDGSNLKQRTSTDITEVSPVWSPDGQTLALIVDPNTGLLQVLGPNDTKPRPVLDSDGNNIQVRGRLLWRN